MVTAHPPRGHCPGMARIPLPCAAQGSGIRAKAVAEAVVSCQEQKLSKPQPGY
ncbi:hypothetical protein ACFZDJ_54900 [Streptomyces sp. NPDC007896]|uniref:hypothetical protein n=1 Tax=Streptomyces sp. NPDC007896 TaxID=3364784 RepID=UPI0036DFECEE